MALKEVLKSMKRKSLLLAEIDNYLVSRKSVSNAYEEENDPNAKAFHPSSLSAVECTRRLTYQILNTQRDPDKGSAKGQKIFDNGHAVGHNIQGYLYDMGILLGSWECVYCGFRWTDMDKPSPKECPDCKHAYRGYVSGEGRWHDLVYREVAIEGWSPSGDRKVLGHADGVFILGGEKYLLEIKSIKGRDKYTRPDTVTFEELNGPLPKHLGQLNLYFEFNTLGITKGVFIYWNKNNQDCKEFQVQKMALFTEKSKNKMDIVDTAIREQILPQRLCQKKGDDPFCPFKEFCFSEHTFDDADQREGVANE